MPVCLTVMLGSFYLIIPFYFYWHSVTSLNFKAKQIILLVTNFPWRHVRNTWRDPFQIRVKWWFATFPTGTMLASGTCFMASGSGLLCYFFYFFFLKEWHTSIGALNLKKKTKTISVDNDLILRQHITLERILIILSNSLFTGTAIY